MEQTKNNQQVKKLSAVALSIFVESGKTHDKAKSGAIDAPNSNVPELSKGTSKYEK